MYTKKVTFKFAGRNSSTPFSRTYLTLNATYQLKGKWDACSILRHQTTKVNSILICL